MQCIVTCHSVRSMKHVQIVIVRLFFIFQQNRWVSFASLTRATLRNSDKLIDRSKPIVIWRIFISFDIIHRRRIEDDLKKNSDHRRSLSQIISVDCITWKSLRFLYLEIVWATTVIVRARQNTRSISTRSISTSWAILRIAFRFW